MSNSYKVYRCGGSDLLWEIPHILAKRIDLEENRLVVLHFGSRSEKVKVITTGSLNKDTGQMGLTTTTMHKLKIPKDIYRLSLLSTENGEFRLGPVIGILTFPHVITKNALGIYTEYAKRMKNTGIIYAFSPDDIFPESNTIKGRRYNPVNKLWQAGEFPYPDAVMDRAYPNSLKAQTLLETEIGINRIFNKKNLISKMDFYLATKNNPSLSDHVPETQLFRYVTDLEYFLKKYGEVFLKPIDSMKGNGIIYVSGKGSTVLCRYMDHNKTLEEVTQTGDIFKIIELTGGRRKTYIIQAAVNRMKCRQRPFCLRVMLTKNGRGQWAAPAIFAKLAMPGAFLTNRSLGSDYILLRDLFECIKNQVVYSREDFLEKITNISLKAATVLDSKYGPLGKLGMDVVIDTSGEPWLIEANGNPGRVCPKVQEEYPEWKRQVYDNPIAYAKYLAGFNISKIY